MGDDSGVSIAGSEAARAAAPVARDNSDGDIFVFDSERISMLALKLSQKLEALHMELRKKKAQFLTKEALALSRPDAPFSNDIDSSLSREQLENVSRDYTKTMLNFEALVKAVKAAQLSLVAGQAMEDNASSVLELDEEEKNYVRGLMDEHKDLLEKILQLEDQKVQVTLDVSKLQEELQEQQQNFSELFPNICKSQDEKEAIVHPGRLLSKKQEVLKLEEDKLCEMKHILQHLLMAVPFGSTDSEMNKKIEDMIIRCGQPLDALRGGEEPL